ncbi:MAG: hypothetical protein ACLPQS_00695 [Acidimicrobiales bacterium]
MVRPTLLHHIKYSRPLQQPFAFRPALAPSGEPLLYAGERVLAWLDVAGAIYASYCPWPGAHSEVSEAVTGSMRLFVTDTRTIVLAYYPAPESRQPLPPTRWQTTFKQGRAYGGQIPHANLSSVQVSPQVEGKETFRFYSLTLGTDDGDAGHSVTVESRDRGPEELRSFAQAAAFAALTYRRVKLAKVYTAEAIELLDAALADPAPEIVDTGRLRGSLVWFLPGALALSTSYDGREIPTVDVRERDEHSGPGLGPGLVLGSGK